MGQNGSLSRRKFIVSSAAAVAAAGLRPGFAAEAKDNTAGQFKFKLKYAPHLGMFKHHAGDDPVDQINFMADEGFTAFEDNGMKDRDVSVQEAIAQAMAKRDMTMGVFVAHKIYWNEPSLTSGDKEKRDEFLSHIRSSVEVAKRVNAKWATVVPGYLDLRKDIGYQTVNVVDALKAACDILDPHGLVMVLEPLNFRDHPGLFLTNVPQAYEICKSVDSASCKILCDIYHQQISAGNIIPNIQKSWDEIAYFQMGDNPGRKEPTTGEINYRNIFAMIHEREFNGVLGMEHGNSRPGKEGERAVIDAYKQVDDF